MDKADLNFSQLPFGYVPTDYNIRYFCSEGQWDDGVLTSSTDVNLHIASQCLHYGQAIFEGLKVYERPDGEPQTFRVIENAKRMIRSAERLLMATVPEEKFHEGVMRVVDANRRFVPPHGSGASLYVRPFEIGSSIQLGLNPSREYMFMVFVAPVGPYYKGTGLTTVKLIVDETVDRAAPLGVGDVKVAGNYAAGIRATLGAKHKGYSEALLLDCKEKKYLDESGSSNFIAITKDGKFVTPASTSVLPSITNDSLQQIARDMGMTVEKRPIEVTELGDFAEAGCVGTAAVLSPVSRIDYREQSFIFGDGETPGPVCTELYKRLTGIQTGMLEDPYGWTEIVPKFEK